MWWEPPVRGLFPLRCLVCGAEDSDGACPRCALRLEAIGSPRPTRRDGIELHAGFPYQWPVRDLLLAGKRSGGGTALRLLAALTAERLRVRGLSPPDAVVPVPLGRKRERWRGFNQAQIVAGALAQPLGAAVLTPLRRTADTATQVGLRPRERARNVRGRFAVHGAVPAAIWVADDVVTTGATLYEAAASLRAAGALLVTGVALAAVPQG